ARNQWLRRVRVAALGLVARWAEVKLSVAVAVSRLASWARFLGLRLLVTRHRHLHRISVIRNAMGSSAEAKAIGQALVAPSSAGTISLLSLHVRWHPAVEE
ncbi:MAG: hypothetical protein F6K19_51210, partial [Cyanothece sp. SIO1E1]|nr:hypothetical protein [Cyanothece sp. SIO1E1]